MSRRVMVIVETKIVTEELKRSGQTLEAVGS